MEKHHHGLSFLVFFLTLLITGGCEEEIPAETVLQGKVGNMLNAVPIHPAFLILGDELLATSDEYGAYEITSLEPGTYSLVCSAVNYGDKSMQIRLEEGKVVDHDFLLSPDDSEGRVYGELHDETLYEEGLVANPSMAGWSDKELFDGVSGATIQTMTFGYDLPASELYIGDSLFSVTDGFGQYWFNVQSGTYPLTISSPGYRDTLKIVKVEPDTRVYANFILTSIN